MVGYDINADNKQKNCFIKLSREDGKKHFLSVMAELEQWYLAAH